MENTAGCGRVPFPLVSRVQQSTLKGLTADIGSILKPSQMEALLPGKMLRTRLAARLLEAGVPAKEGTVTSCCAAVEMVHTGSLCHDDVIDAGLIRRAAPTLWRKTSCSAAVLIGDILICRAIALVLSVEERRYVECFLAKIQQTVAAETEHELFLRNRPMEEEAYLRVARGKTGAMFSFVGRVCGGTDPALSAALEESGYQIGTAYQLADDLLDVIGTEKDVGKTLGSDARRGKFTLSERDGAGFPITCNHIAELCKTTLDRLRAWPAVQKAVAAFLSDDLQPLTENQGLPLNVGVV